ncbi:MAG: YigZ family protein [Andreesenia angusta]|nr:YigZ family protein [Andreesenia angusta]
MILNYKTLHSFGEDEIIINKSRFIGYAKPIKDESEAIDFIEEIRAKHRDATHNVYAYVVGESNNIQRYSDDGEPSGTAGIPVLDIIKKEDLRNVVIVVTRYFGGVKLGAGGLVRAYIKGAKIGLDAAKIVDKNLFDIIKISIDYTLHGKVENSLMSKDFIIDRIEYDTEVNLIIMTEKERTNDLIDLIRDLTSDNFKSENIEEKYFSVIDGKIVK